MRLLLKMEMEGDTTSYLSAAKERRGESFGFGISVVYYANTDTYNGCVYYVWILRSKAQITRRHRCYTWTKPSCFVVVPAVMGVASKLIHCSEQRSRCLHGYPHRESGDRLWWYTSRVEMIIRYGDVTFTRHSWSVSLNLILRQKFMYTCALNFATWFVRARIYVASRCERDPLS